jgi:hypothetical protein
MKTALNQQEICDEFGIKGKQANLRSYLLSIA